MTNIERQFFKTFGIEPKKQGYCDWQSDCPYSDIKCGDDCPYWQYENELKYPKITDRILLELICIANKASIEVIGETVEEMKNKLLEEMIYWKDDIIHKEIQQLFKEEE